MLDPLLEYWQRFASIRDDVAWANRELLSERPNSKASAILEKAALEGDTFAMCRLSAYYSAENTPAFSPANALRWARQAAGKGFAPGYYLLGWYHEHGIGTTVDVNRARQHYEEAAEKGFPIAATYLAAKLVEGQFGRLDHKRAEELLALAAANGDATAAMQLAQWYEEGIGVDADPQKAVKWYQLAAELGNSLASMRLSMAYSFGDLGLTRNKELAEKYLKQSDAGVP